MEGRDNDGHARGSPASVPSAVGRRGPSPSGLIVWILYALGAVMFTALYFETTQSWSGSDFYAYVHGQSSFFPIFRCRVFVPLVARGILSIVDISPKLLFQVLVAVFVLSLLVAYRKYLANFLSSPLSGLCSLAILYPLLWNYCVLNEYCFPFDIPSVLFFVLGCHFIYKRDWRAYYPILVLAILNRETACFLTFVFLVSLYRRMTLRELALHLAAQVVLWLGIRFSLYHLVGGPTLRLFGSRLPANLNILAEMFAFGRGATRHWIHLGLAFGGLWWLVPWVLKRQPVFLKRSLLVVFPFVVAMSFKGVIDEVRLYGELVPVLLTPLVYAIAGGAWAPGRIAKGRRSAEGE